MQREIVIESNFVVTAASVDQILAFASVEDLLTVGVKRRSTIKITTVNRVVEMATDNAFDVVEYVDTTKSVGG